MLSFFRPLRLPIVFSLLCLSEGFLPSPHIGTHRSSHIASTPFLRRISHLTATAAKDPEVKISIKVRPPSEADAPAATTPATTTTTTTTKATIRVPGADKVAQMSDPAPDAAEEATSAAGTTTTVKTPSAAKLAEAASLAAPGQNAPQPPPGVPENPAEVYMQTLDPSMGEVNKVLLGAAFLGDEEKVEEAISKGADVSVKDTNGRTALHLVAGVGLPPACDNLIQAGADINSQDEVGLTPLHMAVGYCRPVTVRRLLEKGADVALIESNQNRTALGLAEQMLEASASKEADGLMGKLGQKKDNKKEYQIWRLVRAVTQADTDIEVGEDEFFDANAEE